MTITEVASRCVSAVCDALHGQDTWSWCDDLRFATRQIERLINAEIYNRVELVIERAWSQVGVSTHPQFADLKERFIVEAVEAIARLDTPKHGTSYLGNGGKDGR